MKSEDWSCIAISKKCVEIIIKPHIQIEDFEFKVLNENRTVIIQSTLITHKFSVCAHSGNPTFIQITPIDHKSSILPSVKYIEGSGQTFYE